MTKASKLPKVLSLPLDLNSDWKQIISRKIYEMTPSNIDLDCNNWSLNIRDIKLISNIIESSGFKINLIRSNVFETIISASALGFETYCDYKDKNKDDFKVHEKKIINEKSTQVIFQKGTLRSGEHLEIQGDIFLVGDVNPGALISATGNVMIWGRLRGTAHAGKGNNQEAKIVALELRPLQLRIADQIARGPDEKPEPGLAEEAIIESGSIVIKPAKADYFRSL